jgi:hypothetical protein
MHRRRGAVLLALAALLVVIAAIGQVSTYADLIWAKRLLGHPLLYGCAAALCAGCGTAQFGETSRVRRLSWAPLSLLALVAWGLIATALSVVVGSTPDEVARVQGGPHTAAVAFDTAVGDGEWIVQIEDTDPGLLSRSVVVGCLQADDNDFRGMEWRANGDLVVHSAHGDAEVRVANAPGSQDVSDSPPGTAESVLGACHS